MQNGQTKLHTSGNGNFKEVIYQIYGRDITKELLEIDTAGDGIRITGFIGKPSISRGNRTFENYYVNGRYVKNKMITKAIGDGYRSFMMQHKFPFTSLFITVNSENVDVNVHPSKMEVRFEKTDLVYQTLYRAICDALTEKELIPEVSFTPKKDRVKEFSRPSVPEPFEIRRREMLRETPAYAPAPATGLVSENTPVPTDTPSSPAVQQPIAKDAETSAASGESAALNRPVVSESVQVKQDGQLSMFEDKNCCRRIHGACTDSLVRCFPPTGWWRWRRNCSSSTSTPHTKRCSVKDDGGSARQADYRQYLAVPIIISLNLQQLALMRKHEWGSSERWVRTGRRLAAKEYTVRAVPYNLFGIADETLLVELIDRMEEETAGSVTLKSSWKNSPSWPAKAAVSETRNCRFTRHRS